MKRRAFMILLGGVATAGPAAAQEKVRRVGLLSNGPAAGASGEPTTWRGQLLRVLAENGFSPGKNLELVDRYGEGHIDRLPQLAREINAAGVDVVLAVTVASVRAMLAASQTTPIVMVVGNDPVSLGFVATLARPGGRVTGVNFRTIEGDAKRLQLLREAIPAARHFGVLVYRGSEPQATEARTRAAVQLDIELTSYVVSGSTEYQAAFAALKKQGVAGVLIESTQALSSDGAMLAAIATAHGLPTICEWDYMARAGCVLGYGHDLSYAHRRVGQYVVRILRGASPAELPVEQSDAWRLTVNLRVATQLGLTLPPALLARADEVIE